ncbi:MAG TPA: alpha/beta hydrolase family protein [Lachnospiraceae bacterium]|nr:alpha/beta hydrolase family protein [Lachnospiraceae bacterium]
MGLLRFSFKSQALSLYTNITVTLPTENMTYYSLTEQKREEGIATRREWEYCEGMKLQTIYVLHGGGDDDTCVVRNTNIERYAKENCVMTVTAQVNDSFYMDTQYGYNYFTFMTEELPKVIQTMFPSSPKREDNFVAGVAMGGNGALALALKRPDLYEACVDLSGGIGCSVDTDAFIEEVRTLKLKRLQTTFGDPDKIRDGPYDLGGYARRHLEKGEPIPKIFIAVGENDFIRDVVRKDKDALKKLGVECYYEEVPDYDHDWNFWDIYLGKALKEWLPLKRFPIYK